MTLPGFESIMERRAIVHRFIMPTSSGPDRTWACKQCEWGYSRRVVLLEWGETIRVFDDLYEHAVTHIGH